MDKTELLFIRMNPKSSLHERVQAMDTILNRFDFSSVINERDKVAVKTHFGDVGNTTHIAPAVIKKVIEKINSSAGKPFLTETATLYPSPRSNGIDHLMLAYEHGFTPDFIGAPILMADGLLGNAEIEVDIPGELYRKVNIARDAVLTDAMIVCSHPTGHIASGLGACLKNLGMGLSTRKGKLQQHSSIKPWIDTEICQACEDCLTWCPENAISIESDYAVINSQECIGCGECLAVCNMDAVKFDWAVESADLQRRIAEYAMGAVIGKRDKMVYINVMTDMTAQCDCMSIPQKPVIDDIGILLGTDPVALDQATLDLTRSANGQDLSHISVPELDPNIQLEHGEKIGLGSRNYHISEIS